MTFKPPAAERLDSLDPEALLTGDQLAAFLNLSYHTVRGWRVDGKGPPYVTLNAITIRYKVKDVRAWLGTLPRSVPADVDLAALGGGGRTRPAAAPFRDAGTFPSPPAFEDDYGLTAA